MIEINFEVHTSLTLPNGKEAALSAHWIGDRLSTAADDLKERSGE
jgi:hypothetical protein